MNELEYASISLRNFNLKVEGYRNRLMHESSNQRRAAFLGLIPHVKKLSYEQFCKDFWPLEIDKHIVEDKMEIDKDYFAKVMAAHNKGKSRFYRNKKKHK